MGPDGLISIICARVGSDGEGEVGTAAASAANHIETTAARSAEREVRVRFVME